MPLNSVPTAGLNRFAMLVAFSLPLACFKGGTDDPVADGTGTETGTETDTEEPCEVATDGCACTTGGGCNPGLECSEGICGPIQSVCGNSQIEPGEACDDGNDDNTDTCTTLCQPPSCDDGIVSGAEVDVDCGAEACGIGCDFGQACLSEEDCAFPRCGPATIPGPDGDLTSCQLPTSCLEWLSENLGADDNIYMIDPDGEAGPIPAMDVFCHMAKDGGGWTLIFVASDDNVNTWTWNDRAKLANEPTTVGSLSATNLDFMSPAYHTLPFTETLFIHQPSNVWAQYGEVSDGVKNMGQRVFETGAPVCDYDLAGQGFPLLNGTLTASGDLCDTDLYFNLGDHELSLTECMNFGSGSNSAAFGPVWNANNGAGCPFDDPAEYGIGPHGPCGACPANFVSTEFNYLGYANALSLNSGTPKAGENYLQMYVR